MGLPMWARALIAFAIVAAIGFACARVVEAIYDAGAEHQRLIDNAERAKEREAARQALDKANAEARVRENVLEAKLAEAGLEREKEKTNAKIAMDKLRADVRAGAERLSIAVKQPAGDSSVYAACSAAAGQSGGETRAELMPEAAIALIDIAADGDEAVRTLNTVIDAYNAARATCNGDQPAK